MLKRVVLIAIVEIIIGTILLASRRSYPSFSYKNSLIELGIDF
ncbi:uncharacterized protein ACLA_038200 [Aspergillus clavatus NRRL 1]|uniref:Uncharacterized protein n=1 Tax=Aspergillus clavatus (strain ATCC 1007 / CBS 513.65 / DSM 816 / NCTC 3887 / NRRL 1 / QM 1276 / 107) TaxID=344612 RepID=A1CKD5_ASPCL|nr:uncharacterized protein ACLA_038200 [Aspergillus clavatus NRRL 1]EAW09609.1 hypothetical protein ACLA_038200 [Aspergillus clavatus NRRL 1]